MEEIITRPNTCYIINGEKVSVYAIESFTPLYGVISIDYEPYQCVPPLSGASLCEGCHFHDDCEGCVCYDLPCGKGMRADGNDVIFIKKNADVLEEKVIYTTDDFKNLKTYRFNYDSN